MPYLAPRPVEGGSAPVLTPEEEALLAAEGEAIPPPDTSMYAAPVEAQYQPGGSNYVADYDPGAQYGMGSSGGDPAVAWAESQPTDPYNTAPSGTYPSDPIPAPASGSPYTSGSSALYGAGAVDAFNGGYPVTGGTQPMGFDPDPTVDPEAIPPPNPAAAVSPGGGGYVPRSPSLDWSDPRNLDRRSYEDARRVLDVQRGNVPPPTQYNWGVAEPGPPKPMPDSNPVVTPDMQPVEQAMGDVIPNMADALGQFFGPILGRPGLGRTNAGDQARRVQDTIGGMILTDPEKPQSVAGEAGRQAGQAIAPIIDRAAEGLVGGARNAVLASAGLAPSVADRGLDMVRLSAGVPPKREPDKGLRPVGGTRAVGEQEPIPSPDASIPDRMGSWLQSEVIQPGTQVDPALVAAGDWLSKNVIDPLTTPRESTATPQRGAAPAPDLGGRTDMRDENIPSTNPQTPEDWAGASTRSLQLMQSYDPTGKSWATQLERKPIQDANGAWRRGIAVKGVADEVGNPLYVGYEDANGKFVPVGADAVNFRTMLLDAAEGPALDEIPAPADATTTTSSTPQTTTGQTTLEDVTWTGDTPSSGGSGSWNDSWSGGSSRSSGRRSSSWDDFDNGFDSGREFTADDFLDAADGDYRKAERMARSANKRRKRKGQTTSGNSGFWDGFPFNRPPSPMREYILTAIAESRAAGAQRQR